MEYRVEKDSIGNVKVPINSYWGPQTQRGVQNFRASGIVAHGNFITAYAMIKKAAARANMTLGSLDEQIGRAIIEASDKIIGGEHRNHFPIDVYQAGAGTSFNMNMNEVLANLALGLLGHDKGRYDIIHPNDHVNMGQSTNDTFPTAMHISIILSMPELDLALEDLEKTFHEKSREFHDIIKSGRTHLQDAMPVRLGKEFKAYCSAIKWCRRRLQASVKKLRIVALGGSASGTGINTHVDYSKIATEEISKMLKMEIGPSSDLQFAMQSMVPLADFSSALKSLAGELGRISNDLRLLSSGPTAGLGEIKLPAVQPGSSIMPGKVNPVMAECMNMICFQVIGNDLTVSLAVGAGQLELNVMMPVMIHNILESMRLLSNYLPDFVNFGIKGISTNRERCEDCLEKNPSLATFLAPHIGYLKAAEVAKEALERRITVKELVLEKGLLSSEEVEKIFKPEFLLGEELRL